ncbi:hypothetical protein ACJ73_03179 [Blastomyces percursus]|uniref:Uncharacterized protein n=1 Tax=Blastomyces percursus TaxID=1658174 RepID=A0A1J9RA99_9EURO|nr:hypothetical protein ACJ73_03179 [Blastomyces percursus]
MSARTAAKVPDAWDDNWEAHIDSEPHAQDEAAAPSPAPVPGKKLSSRAIKAQKRAQHAEFNRRLWAEAESPQTFHFLESRAASVPLRSDFKPPVTVLSRKPQLAKRQHSQSQSPSAVSLSPSSSASGALDAATAGIQHLSASGTTSPATGATTTTTIALPPEFLPNDDDDDSDDDDGEEGPKLTPEELQAQREREREERQRKYEEVRERLFGSPSRVGSGASSRSSTSTTPPPLQSQSQVHSHHSHSHRQGLGMRGKGRAGRPNASSRESRERKEISANCNNNNNNKSNRQLYDPNYPMRSTSGHGPRGDRRQKYVNDGQENGLVQEKPQQSPRQQTPLRTPRGPDGSGRGGFGFSPRGAKSLVNQLHSNQPI